MIPREPERRTVAWRGGSLSMLIRDGRPPGLLLLHGLCGGARHFEPVFASCPLDNQALIALDLPGFGLSANLGARSLDELADATIHAMEAVGWSRPVIAAHSMAASVAVRLRHIASAIALLEGNLLPIHLRFSDRVLAASEAVFAAEFPRMQATASMILKFQTKRVAPEMLQRFAETWSQCAAETVWQLAAAFNPEVRSGAVLERFSSFEGPLLCLYGTDSEYATTVSELSHALPSAKLCPIEGAAHYLMLDAPSDTVRALVSLLERTRDHAEFATC